MNVFYLHGFTSSNKSTKAGYFAERLSSHGIILTCPDFNRPDFETLTMTRMLDQLSAEMDAAGPGRVTLIGSSLGGTLAILAADRFTSRVERLILLAPAVMFGKPDHHLLPPERIDEWRRRGRQPFFHYAYNEERPLDFAFYEDTLRYSAFDAKVSQPTLMFQGFSDRSVDYRTVEQFAASRPNVTLTLLNDDHQLAASLPHIWRDVEAFVGLS